MRTIYVDKDIPRILLTKAISPRWPGFVWTPFSSVIVADQPDPPPTRPPFWGGSG